MPFYRVSCFQILPGTLPSIIQIVINFNLFRWLVMWLNVDVLLM
jgi:hypothetical protein